MKTIILLKHLYDQPYLQFLNASLQSKARGLKCKTNWTEMQNIVHLQKPTSLKNNILNVTAY